MVTEPLLPGRIQLNVVLIIIKEIQLNFCLTGLIQKLILIDPRVRIDLLRIRRQADGSVLSCFQG